MSQVPKESRIVPPNTRMKIFSRGRANPTSEEMAKRINELEQPGLTATVTADPLKIWIEYDSHDDVDVLRNTMVGTTWIFQ